MITTTQGWMLGIIGAMIVFGIAAGIFSRMGKKRNNLEEATETVEAAETSETSDAE